MASRKDARRFQPRTGRPTAAQATAIDHAILNAASERFLADGYAGASLDAIIAAAGVSSGTLYSRYRDKKSLFQAFAKDHVNVWQAKAFKQNWKLGNTIAQRLKHQVKIVVTLGISTEGQAFTRLFVGASGYAPEMARVLHEMRYERMIKVFTQEIRDFARADGIPARHPRHVAELLMAAIAGWFTVQLPIRPVSARDSIKFANRTIDLLMSGRSGW